MDNVYNALVELCQDITEFFVLSSCAYLELRPVKLHPAWIDLAGLVVENLLLIFHIRIIIDRDVLAILQAVLDLYLILRKLNYRIVEVILNARPVSICKNKTSALNLRFEKERGGRENSDQLLRWIA